MSKQAQKTAIRAHQERTGSNYTTARREVLSGASEAPRGPFLAQAASSTDPAVLRAIADAALVKRYALHLRMEFAERVTGESKFIASGQAESSGSVVRMRAVAGEKKPGGEFGRWKRNPYGPGWVPAVNSKMEAEFESLNEDIPSIPLPGIERVEGGIFRGNFILYPQVFALNGRAWLRFSADPTEETSMWEGENIDPNWVPERNSDAVRALEDWREEREARRGQSALAPLGDDERARVEVLVTEHREREQARRERRAAAFAAARRPSAQ